MKTADRLPRLAAAALLALIVTGLAGGWWIIRPKWAAERFTVSVAHGKFDEADAMLTGASSLHLNPAGELVVTDSQGKSATLGRDELPLQPMERFNYQPRPTNADYFAGRYHFRLTTTGPSVQGEEREPRVVSAIATPSGIVIDTAAR